VKQVVGEERRSGLLYGQDLYDLAEDMNFVYILSALGDSKRLYYSMHKTETTSVNKLQNPSEISEQPSSDTPQSQFSIKKLLLWTTGIAVGITVWSVSRENSTVDPIPALLNVSAYIVVVSGIAAIVRYSQKPLDARQSQAVSLDVWLPTAMNGAILVFFVFIIPPCLVGG